MDHALLVDHTFVVSRHGYIVRALVRLTGHSPQPRSRVPINISVVLDRSGSMAGTKLRAAREAAAFLVERLAPDDVVSVVAYDDRIETVAPPATGAEQVSVSDAIRAIRSGGSTNLSGGWLRGREHVLAGRREGAVNRVLLLTDGQANAGIVDPEMLSGLARGANREGITTSTIGFGADYDEGLLRAMADAGGGNAWYIERPDQAMGVFEEEIDGLLSLSAQNVAVEIRPGADVQLAMVHNDYPYAATAGAARRYELGDLYAREPRSLLVEFFVPGLDEQPAAPVATIVVHAHVLTEAGGIERQEVTFPVTTALGRRGHVEPEIRREVLLSTVARAREEAVARERRGDHAGAGAVLREAADAIAGAAPDLAFELAAECEALRATSSMVAESGFTDADRKYEAQRSYNARRGKAAYDEKLRRPPRPPR